MRLKLIKTGGSNLHVIPIQGNNLKALNSERASLHKTSQASRGGRMISRQQGRQMMTAMKKIRCYSHTITLHIMLSLYSVQWDQMNAVQRHYRCVNIITATLSTILPHFTPIHYTTVVDTEYRLSDETTSY